MRWSPQEYERYVARQAATKRPARVLVQELKDDSAGQVDNRPKEAETNGVDYPKFHLSVDFLVSDQRDRDGDGMLNTICDCLISAIGRLSKVDSKTQRKLANSLKRKRRGSRNN